MADKEKSSFSKTIVSLIIAVPALYRLVNNFIALIELEAKLAERSLVRLFILYLVLGSLLTSVWLGILAMLSLYLVSLQLSWLMSLFIVFVMNILLLLIVGLIMLRVKHDFSFPRTRCFIRNICGK